MSYLSIRKHIKPGDLISFSDHPSIISRLISLRTKSKHTHSAMVISKHDAIGKRLLIAEALNCGPTVNYLSNRVEAYNGVVWWFPLRNVTAKQRNIANEWVWDKVCSMTKYDYRSIWKQLFSKVSVDAAQLFCSEMVQMAWAEAEIIANRIIVLDPGELTRLRNVVKRGMKLNK